MSDWLFSWKLRRKIRWIR